MRACAKNGGLKAVLFFFFFFFFFFWVPERKAGEES